MNTRARGKTHPRSMKPPLTHEKVSEEMQGSKSEVITNSISVGQGSTKERKLALQQDVNKLKKKLRLEENIHRALVRAFNRPLGALPRLPPYLPPCTLKLLAEVAVLEEEVVKLEEQVVHFRQDLYQEAVCISSSKRILDSPAQLRETHPIRSPRLVESKYLDQTKLDLVSTGQLQTQTEDRRGKENQLCSNFSKSGKRTSGNRNKLKPTVNQAKQQPIQSKSLQKLSGFEKKQQEKCSADQDNVERRRSSPKEKPSEETPNLISENILKCLSRVLLRMSTVKNHKSANALPSSWNSSSQECDKDINSGDPYDICEQFGKRDIGRYKQLLTIDAQSFNSKRREHTLFLLRQLKILFGKLASVKLENLTHQEKLAFWINIYNSCMMHAFIDQGIPDSAEMVVMLMQKATINVGGHLLNAITIEHFILRLPYHCKFVNLDFLFIYKNAEYSTPSFSTLDSHQALAKKAKNSEVTARSIFRLEFSEPLITFALSCGSWSSPAVRVYTASHVETELEVAKREYLQAAIGISTTKFAIPKLLDWYLLDFAKDLDSLLDWICLQLPSELGKEAIKLLESKKCVPSSQFIHIMPYEFNFRYILCT